MSIKHIALLILLSFNHSISAEDAPLEFDDPVQKDRYYELIEEVRCLVCQNQSLSDSNAELAQDLRNEIYQKIIAGEKEKDIIHFLTQRYGDFVLYRPPFESNTLILWLGPFALLIIIAVVTILNIRKQSLEEEDLE